MSTPPLLTLTLTPQSSNATPSNPPPPSTTRRQTRLPSRFDNHGLLPSPKNLTFQNKSNLPQTPGLNLPVLQRPVREVRKQKTGIKLRVGSANSSAHRNDQDEDFPVEEHIILRLPDTKDVINKAHEFVKKLNAGEEVHNNDSMKVSFVDARRAVVTVADHRFKAKLVDLPCINESVATVDGTSWFKIGDISQMLVAEVGNDLEFSRLPLSEREYTWPHGLTPPLKYVRKRRFRPRKTKRTLETVEQEVQRLLLADADAVTTSFELVDVATVLDDATERSSDMDEDDAELAKELEDELLRWKEGEMANEDVSEISRPAASRLAELGVDSPRDSDTGKSGQGEMRLDGLNDIDEAADEDGDDDEEEEDEEEDDEDNEEIDSDDDPEVASLVQQQYTLESDMNALLEKIAEKQAQLNQVAGNQIMRMRFESVIETLQGEVDLIREKIEDMRVLILDARNAGREDEEDAEQKDAQSEGEDEPMIESADITVMSAGIEPPQQSAQNETVSPSAEPDADDDLAHDPDAELDDDDLELQDLNEPNNENDENDVDLAEDDNDDYFGELFDDEDGGDIVQGDVPLFSTGEIMHTEDALFGVEDDGAADADDVDMNSISDALNEEDAAEEPPSQPGEFDYLDDFLGGGAAAES